MKKKTSNHFIINMPIYFCKVNILSKSFVHLYLEERSTLGAKNIPIFYSDFGICLGQIDDENKLNFDNN